LVVVLLVVCGAGGGAAGSVAAVSEVGSFHTYIHIQLGERNNRGTEQNLVRDGDLLRMKQKKVGKIVPGRRQLERQARARYPKGFFFFFWSMNGASDLFGWHLLLYSLLLRWFWLPIPFSYPQTGSREGDADSKKPKRETETMMEMK
jgi:hypothetical protein